MAIRRPTSVALVTIAWLATACGRHAAGDSRASTGIVGRDASSASNGAAEAHAPLDAGTPLLFEDPQDMYTSDTPNRHVRFYVTNRSAISATLRVTSVAAKHGSESFPLAVAGIMVDDINATQPAAMPAGERHLVTVALFDAANVLRSIHDDFDFALGIEVNGAVQSVSTHVVRGVRERRYP